MKLPIQAQPISRKGSSVRMTGNPGKYVNASDCKADCAWVLTKCIPAALGGLGPYIACLSVAAAHDPHCQGCVKELAEATYVEDCRGRGCGTQYDL